MTLRWALTMVLCQGDEISASGQAELSVLDAIAHPSNRRAEVGRATEEVLRAVVESSYDVQRVAIGVLDE